MDDVVIASTYKAGHDESQERAVERLSELKYHDSMVLERTDDDTAEWQRYLEGEIGISEYRMTLRFFNVNSVSLLKNGTCIKQRAQSGASYISTYVIQTKLHLWCTESDEMLRVGTSPNACNC